MSLSGTTTESIGEHWRVVQRMGRFWGSRGEAKNRKVSECLPVVQPLREGDEVRRGAKGKTIST